MDRAEAEIQIRHFWATYLAPHYDDVEFSQFLTDNAVAVYNGSLDFYGLSPSEAWAYSLHTLTLSLANLSGAFEVTRYEIDKTSAGLLPYADTVAPDALVDLLYPDADAATRDAMIDAIESGQISGVGFVGGVLELSSGGNDSPSAGELLDVIPPLPAPEIPIPELDLSFPGVNDAQLDFLVGVYVAAFNRAPEHDGLSYWAGKLKDSLESGQSEPDAYKAVTRDMYWSGEQHGEAGTDLNNADYVTFLYQTVLGREPETAGYNHWLNELDSGASPRNEFLTVFLTSALEPGNGDGLYVQARVEVAKYAAQAHISGAGSTIDLAGVLAGVTNAEDAEAAIREIVIAYGTIGETETTEGETIAYPGLPSMAAEDFDSWFAQTIDEWPGIDDDTFARDLAAGPSPSLDTAEAQLLGQAHPFELDA